MEEIIDKQYRNFMVLFYDESKHYNFDDVIFNLHGFKYYAYIKHLPEDEEKTSHYHAFLHLDSATTESAVAKRLGIPKEKVQNVKSFRSACRYLTHIDFPDKIQYDLSDVKVSGIFQRKFLKQFEDIKTEEEILTDIYNYIDELPEGVGIHLATRMFIQFINSNCYDTIYKRYRPELTEYLRWRIMKR